MRTITAHPSEYAEQPQLKLRLPVTMVESYNIPGNALQLTLIFVSSK